MNISFAGPVGPTLLVFLTFASSLRAQTFTRVVDPTNPIVTDTFYSGGACWIDLDDDGYLDLFVANGNLNDQPNQLYLNDDSGGFTRAPSSALTTDGGSSIGVTAGDYDNDGRLDLFVTNRNNFGNFLYRGLGGEMFEKITAGPLVIDIGNSNSSSWVDIDGDEDLDLYVVNFQGADFLYRNEGPPNFAFTRIDTTAATPGTEFSIQGIWSDYDNDGDPDLFIGNAGTQNDYLYSNHGNLLLTRTVIPDGLSTLGCSWGDWNDDGNNDLLGVHYSNQRCTLYRNGGSPEYELLPVTSAVTSLTGNWVGSAFGDYDNDGALDLFIARDGGASALYHNDGPPSFGFTRVLTGPIATDTGNAFGAVWGDYDRDGQLDLFISDRLAAPNRLYHNEGTSNHWLTLRCRGLASASGIGARIRVRAVIGGTPRWQHREVTGQTGYNCQNLDQHFGLGDAAVADSIVVDWPSGRRDVWTDVAADDLLTLQEASSVVATPEFGPPAGATFMAGGTSPNPSGRTSTISLRVLRPTRLTIELIDLRGRRLRRLDSAEFAIGDHRRSFAIPSEVPAGVYFYRVSDGVQSQSLRVVIAR